MLLICTASSGHNLTLARRIAELADELNLPNQVVDLTKTDLPHVAETVDEKLAALKAAVKHGRVLSLSSHGGSNVRKLLKRTRSLLDQLDGIKPEDSFRPAP